jgi:drug/metabolite transporter (DMT)-like permease
MQRRTRWLVAIGLMIAGLVWIGQGSGLLRGSSFMVDDAAWAIAGAVAFALGATFAIQLIRHRPRA